MRGGKLPSLAARLRRLWTNCAESEAASWGRALSGGTCEVSLGPGSERHRPSGFLGCCRCFSFHFQKDSLQRFKNVSGEKSQCRLRTQSCFEWGREYTKCYINTRTFQDNELGTRFPHSVSGIGTRVSPCCLPGDCYPGHLPLEDDPCFNLHRISEAIKRCMKKNSELVEEISRCTQKDDIKTLEKMNEILDDVIQDIHTELQSKRDQCQELELGALHMGPLHQKWVTAPCTRRT
ncbi:uncharacterized protein [Vicugna pacos]|uniref:Uncharacterized protein n=1 Tax=Vicugna pacos TaxID=30538 RepID=A0ABM5DN99_VICPA